MVGSRASPFAGMVVWITGTAVVHEHGRVVSYMKRRVVCRQVKGLLWITL